MKAAVLNAQNGTFDIEDIQIDSPRKHEVLVEIKASGLCHSDLHVAENHYPISLPAVMGHEFSGIVKEIGPEVSQFAVGDHVVGSPVRACGHCDACFGGQTCLCKHPEEAFRDPELGHRLTRDGKPLMNFAATSAFAEFSLVHENLLAKVPKEMPFPQAAVLGCAVVAGAGAALNAAHVRPGDTVVVIGVGGLGLNVISASRLVGAAQIIGIDVQPKKEELARKFGATDFLNSTVVDPIETVKALTAGGADHVFEVVGLKKTSEQALKMVRRGGCAYMLGVHKAGSTVDLDVMGDLIFNQLTVKGVQMGWSNIKRDIPMYANLYLQGRFNLDDLVSKEINIFEINEAYQELKTGAIARSVITSF